MNMQSNTALRDEKLSDGDFGRLSRLITTVCGIRMPPQKKTMLQSRLQKRLRGSGIGSLTEYCKYLFTPDGMKSELVNMIDVVTTNKTDFFREPEHFDLLRKNVLPELMNERGAGTRKPLEVWSAGCSTGEEPYTLAMVLGEFAEMYEGFRYSILATDISTKVIEKARVGIYKSDIVAPVPLEMKKRYLLRSKDKSRQLVRVAPELRACVRFKRLNLMDESYMLKESFDVIFFRNVLIYFDKPTQEVLLNRICGHLKSGGFIIIGHSETLHGLNVPLVQIVPTVYRKKP
jgi:chemotaxis protein methyltransferase CheR